MQKKNGNLVLRKQSFRWGLMFGLSMGEPLFFPFSLGAVSCEDTITVQ